MFRRIELYADEHGMLKTEDLVIAGVSGGADSICLLFVLLKLQKKIGFQIIVVHVNHGIRGIEADEDQGYVEKICHEQKVPIVVYKKNVELIAKNRKQSMEEAGRDIRKEAFCETARNYNGTKIALAHHMNDNAETLIFNMARGAGLRGIGGIRPVNGMYIRPLLCVSRQEIEQYLEARDIYYCTDGTNQTDDYTRNRIRNHVIPYLEETVNKKTVQHMNRTMAYLNQVTDYIEKEAFEWYQKASLAEPEGISLKKEVLNQAPEVLKPLIIQNAIQQVAGSRRDIASVHLTETLDLLTKQTGRKISLPYGVEALSDYDKIQISRAETVNPTVLSAELELTVPGETAVNGQKIQWRLFDNINDFWPEEKTYTKWFDYDIIKKNVTVRTRKEGDYITINKDGHTKKLKKFFVDEKIPGRERDRILLIAEGSHVLWIVGYRMNAAYQIHAHTKHILEIVINGGEKNGRNSKSTNTGE